MTDDITALRRTTPPSGTKAARDLDAGELRDVITEGVYRGVMKAIAVYALIGVLIWVVVLLAACSSTGPSAGYTVLVTNVTTGGENWTANDSAAPASWTAPASGWQAVAPAGTWCIHVPTSEQVVQLTEVSSAPGANNFIFGSVHPSVTAPTWNASEAPGHIATTPGPAC